jgi:hypothetical protein
MNEKTHQTTFSRRSPPSQAYDELVVLDQEVCINPPSNQFRQHADRGLQETELVLLNIQMFLRNEEKQAKKK